MDERMKYISTNIAPNGSIPPKNMAVHVLMYHGCALISLGSADGVIGTLITSCEKPTYAPKKTKGSEMQNHRSMRTTRVPNGTADDDLWAQAMALTLKNMMVTTPGSMMAVRRVALKWFCSLTYLQYRAVTYPAGAPMRTYEMRTKVSSAPLLAGDSTPKAASTKVSTVMTKTCAPDPRHTERRVACAGGLKTSLLTSFHPVSSLISRAASALSSSLAPALYRARSLRSTRAITRAMMQERKKTTTAEFTIENQ
mmetsp:Transcript_2791/g.6268  ORF Transcript_2791/g.6268 Transcript_2791/m.6268 type:complete len:254 (-) Transcript_2791:128-889(-)